MLAFNDDALRGRCGQRFGIRKTDTLLFQFVTREESVYEKSPENRKKPAALVSVNRAAGFYEKGNNEDQTLFLKSAIFWREGSTERATDRQMPPRIKK